MLKRFLISFALTLITISVAAQTPYDAFAPEQSIKCMNVLEHKDYLLENSDSTARVKYVAIDWSKSSYTLIGKEGINTGAGELSELDKKFLTVDPHSEDYTSSSPYAYCMGDPISYVDPSGKDIAILLVNDNSTSSMDGNHIGHLAILIQNDEGKWLYYSINGVESSSGASDRNDVAIEGNWDTPQEFLRMTNRESIDNDSKSNQNLNLYNYTDAYVIKTTPEQDNAISQTFSDYAKTKYNFISNNCATIVQNSIISGGIKLSPNNLYLPASTQFGGYGPTINSNINVIYPQPRAAFSAIMKANKGLYIKK